MHRQRFKPGRHRRPRGQHRAPLDPASTRSLGFLAAATAAAGASLVTLAMGLFMVNS